MQLPVTQSLGSDEDSGGILPHLFPLTMKGRACHTVPILAALQVASLFPRQLQAQSDVSDSSIRMVLIQANGIPSPFQFVC